MRRAGFGFADFVLPAVGVVYAGEEVLSGPIFGVLSPGTVCTIGDNAYVPADKSLLFRKAWSSFS
jgi:hypothetical protein